MSGFFGGGGVAVGTLIAGLSIGDLLVGGAAGVLAVVPDVAVGQVLVSGGVGVAPLWSAAPTFPTWSSTVADGAAAVAHIIDGPAYANATALLLSVRNNGAEKLSVTKDGAIRGKASPGGSGPALWSDANTGTNAGRIFTDDATGSFIGYGASANATFNVSHAFLSFGFTQIDVSAGLIALTATSTTLSGTLDVVGLATLTASWGVPAAQSQSTVGAAGAASALPLLPTGYVKIKVNSVDKVIPYYDVA